MPDEAARYAEQIRPFVADKSVLMLGPGPCPKEHLRGQVRWQILVKCFGAESLKNVVRAMQSVTQRTGMKVTVDVDPYDFA